MPYTLIQLAEGLGYEKEEGTKSDKRMDKLRVIEKRLKGAIKALDEAKRGGAPKTASDLPAAGRVKALAQFHGQKASQGPEIERLSKQILELRQWLTRQGTTLLLDGSIVGDKSANLVVLYDTDLQRKNFTKVEIAGGIWRTPGKKFLDTKFMSTAFSGVGKAIYVMSGEGNLFVAPHIIGHRHHSSLLSGQPVAGAGELQVINGRLKWLSNKSGHYQPTGPIMVQVVQRLEELAVSLDSYAVEVVEGTTAEGTPYKTAQLFIDAYTKPPEITEVLDTGYAE